MARAESPGLGAAHKEEAVGLGRRTARGSVWTATSAWVQLGVSLCTFAIMARHLSPSQIGAFGIVALLIGLADMMTGTPLGESLQQRRVITKQQVDATFWIGAMLATVAALLLALVAEPIARATSAPEVAPLLHWGVLALPLTAALAVPNALLARELRFDRIASTAALVSLAQGLVTIAGIWLGAGVWSLLLADLCGRGLRLAGLWRASGYRPGPPRDLGAIVELMRFNGYTFATYLLGYADRSVPRLLTGFILGAAPLGYLVLAQRVLDLLTELVLRPFNSVTMAAVARLQDQPHELRRLILTLYRSAAIFAYPAFAGLIVIVPDLARLAGATWLPAVLATQIMLVVGLRTATGMFNIPILRGTGHGEGPLYLLGAGLLLNLILVPLAAPFGIAAIAAAVLLRTLVTWPLGCWLVRRATGISVMEQIMVGARSLASAVVMAALTWLLLAVVPWEAALPRLLIAIGIGGAIYALAIAILVPSLCRSLLRTLSLVIRGDRRAAVEQLRSGLAIQGLA